MSLTLLQLCQTALQERGEFSVPATIVGNSDPTAVRLLALANRAGRWTMKENTWQALVKTYTFSTSNGVSDYAIPSDLDRFLNLTFWDRTYYRYVKGPISAAEMELLRSSRIAMASQFYSYFRIVGNLFTIYPTPAATRTFAYQYAGKNWITADGDSSPSKEYFTADSDTCSFNDDIMVLGIKERFQAAIDGVEWQPSTELTSFIGKAVMADGGKDVIVFGPGPLVGPLGRGNLPETGYGNP